VGRHCEVGRSGEDAAALGIGEGQRGYLVPVNRPNIGDGRGRRTVRQNLSNRMGRSHVHIFFYLKNQIIF
jgi:hypothetical protein